MDLVTLSDAALNRAQAAIVQAKAIANLAGQIEVDGMPEHALSNAMWALSDLLGEANELLCQAKFAKMEGGGQ